MGDIKFCKMIRKRVLLTPLYQKESFVYALVSSVYSKKKSSPLVMTYSQ